MRRVGGYQAVHRPEVRHIPLEQRGGHANWRTCTCPDCRFVQTLHAEVRAKIIPLEQTFLYGPAPRFFDQRIDHAPPRPRPGLSTFVFSQTEAQITQPWRLTCEPFIVDDVS